MQVVKEVTKSALGITIKVLAVLGGIISVLYALIYSLSIDDYSYTSNSNYEYSWGVALSILIGGIISTLITYGIGATVCKTHENNQILKNLLFKK